MARGRIPCTLVAVGSILCLAVSCGDDDSTTGGTGATTTESRAPAEGSTSAPGGGGLDDVAISGHEVMSAEQPTSLVALPGTGTLLVAERPGRIRAATVTGEGSDRRYALDGDPVLDISDEVTAEGAEQGLLDIEPSDDGATLYVSYTAAPGGDTRIDAYPLAVEGQDVALDAHRRREVLAVEQPYRNHNGGDVEIGPDGFLYVGLGDGGGAGDPEGNAQDLSTLLGSILRLDPTRTGGPGGTDGYAVPDGNPVTGDEGRPEMWLHGVRNPWRFTFDAETGDLWVADVGQDQREEIDLLPAREGGAGKGANLGWPAMEGSAPYAADGNPEGAVLPVFDYGHDEGCSITGGVVYRGGAIDGLDGAYLFSDYCAGSLRALRADGGEVTAERTFDLTPGPVVSFGVDGRGDVYLLTLDGPIVRLDPAG